MRLTLADCAFPTRVVTEPNASLTEPTQPLVSLCIPTFNRARYLRCLLPLLVEELAEFPHACEVVVSDNASTDDTAAVLAEFAGRLPLRVFRHAVNRGPYANLQFVLGQGQGTFLVYLADDDMLAFAELATLVDHLQAHPNISAAYAPWLIHDLVDNRTLGAFYRQESDVLVRRGDHHALADTILRLKAFPEISVVRREVWQALNRRPPAHAFWAFVFASAYVDRGDVLFSAKPFYVSISRYFAGPPRAQVGLEEVEASWDSYRGGLEAMLARATSQLSGEQHAALLAQINPLIGQRLAVALRLRVSRGRDPVDNYTLACRLKGLGHEKLLPMPLSAFALQASLGFLAQDHHLFPELPPLVCHPTVPSEARQMLERLAPDRVSSFVPVEPLSGCVLVIGSSTACSADQIEQWKSAGVRKVSLAEALARFPA